MQGSSMAALVLLAAYFSASVSAQNLGFGPQGCVQISRSEAGSCVITTNCDGQDISTTDFAFDCVNNKAITRHSFGTGGFESFEEFDSDVKCEKCENVLSTRVHAPQGAGTNIPAGLLNKRLPVSTAEVPVLHPGALPVLETPAAEHRSKPSHKQDVDFEFEPLVHPIPVRRPVVPAAAPVNFNAKSHQDHHHHHIKHHHDHSAKAHSSSSSKWNFPWNKKKVEHKVVKYGPKDCIETYKNKNSECVIQTRCAAEDVSSYNFGMICVGEDGVPVNHVFGKGSFDPEEKFNTLIKCKKCMGLEDIPEDANVQKPKSAMGQVEELHNEIKDLTSTLLKLGQNVNNLNSAVFPHKAGAPAPAAATSPAAAAAPKASFLVKKTALKEDSSEDANDDDDSNLD